MPALNPYLHFDGNTEEVFNFYKSVFGGEFSTLMRYKDAPAEYRISDSEKILHMDLPIGNGSILLGSDVPEVYGRPVAGNNFFISVDANSEDEANKLFNGLSAGGKVTMPIDKTFWGAYFGMLTDKFGIQWMVSYDYNRQK